MPIPNYKELFKLEYLQRAVDTNENSDIKAIKSILFFSLSSSQLRQAVPSSHPSWQSCLYATLPSCHNTFRHQFCVRWGCVWGQWRHRRIQRPGGNGHVCVCVGATAVALPLCGYPSPQWAAPQPWIWSLQRLTSVGCHFREIDDRPRNGIEGGKDGWGRRRREGWREWERRARGINGESQFRPDGNRKVSFSLWAREKEGKKESATDLKDCRGPKVWHNYGTKYNIYFL